MQFSDISNEILIKKRKRRQTEANADSTADSNRLVAEDRLWDRLRNAEESCQCATITEESSRLMEAEDSRTQVQKNLIEIEIL